MGDSFSERYGYKAPIEALRREIVDDRLQNDIWNLTLAVYKLQANDAPADLFLKWVWARFFGEALDDPTMGAWPLDTLRKHVYAMEWNEWLDFVQFVSRVSDAPQPLKHRTSEFAQRINKVLERNRAAYRLVDDCVIEITDSTEITSIQDAMALHEREVTAHLREAIRILSDRNANDFRNSIKESVSAVEAAARLFTGNPGATLSDALRILKNDGDIHAALREALTKMYAYTSDADGIRHAMMDEPNLDYADAKYMLVVCTAFVNLLTAKRAN